MRWLSLVAAVALATACDKADDEALRKSQEKVLEKLDALEAKTGAVADLERKLDQQAKQLDELHAQLAELERRPAAAAAQPPQQRRRRPEPDPKDVYAVPIDGDPSVGPADALVTIVKGYEYACPFCDKVRPTLESLRTQYGDDLRVVYKQFVVHPQTATLPAQAICAAHRQHKFEVYDKLVWEKAYAANRDFSQANLEKLAGEAKLDLVKFKADMQGPCVEHVRKDQRELQAVGQGATPTFFINGRYMSGAQPLATFQKIVEEELALARGRVAGGSRKDYYQRWVIERGLPQFTPPP